MKLSILIPTLEERKDSFDFIYNKLLDQKTEGVEIIPFEDNREYSIGYKRNFLLENAKGEYTCFVDDDDDVSDTYIKDILEALKSNPDCVSLVGVITFAGKDPRSFIHSLKYTSYFEKDLVYYRPPNHLNPIKRDLAVQFKFPEKNFGEDTDWAMQICKAGILKTEVEINHPYYFYKFEPNK